MADRLAARSALAAFGPRTRHGRGGAPGLTIRERRGLVSLRVQRCDGREDPPEAFPAEPGATALSDGVRRIGLRAGEWLAIGDDPQGRDGRALQGLRADLGPVFAVMDESHGRTSLVLEGPAAEAVLQKGIAVDLAILNFGAGRAMQAGLAGLPVLLLRQAESRFLLQVARGLAVGLMEWLLATGALEGVEVVIEA